MESEQQKGLFCKRSMLLILTEKHKISDLFKYNIKKPIKKLGVRGEQPSKILPVGGFGLGLPGSARQNPPIVLCVVCRVFFGGKSLVAGVAVESALFV